MPQNEVINQVRDKERARAARDMLTALFMLAKSARFYESNNETYQRQSERFFESLQSYMESYQSCTIKVVKDRWFIDERFININTDDKLGAESIITRWGELGIGGIIIGNTAQAEQIDILVNEIWIFDAVGETRLQKLSGRLAELGVDSIALLPPQQLVDGAKITVEDRKQIRRHARDTFFQAITMVKQVMASASRQEKIPVARTKRIVHSIIDQISKDEAALIELASIKDYDEYTYAHCTNVGVYALTLGFRLGLSRKELSELGFAALFHDIGKIKLPNDLINKPDKYDEFDWKQMKKHPLYGAMTIAKSFKLDSHMSRAMAVAFEHHINPDYSGYPNLPDKRPLNLYSRIVAIADSFDALSSGRIYIKEPIPPDEVLRKLMYQMKGKFDAILLKLFVNIVGIYPVGSLVLLSNKTIGVVSKTNSEDLHRPEIRIIADQQGEKTDPFWLDLNAEENKGIEIVRIIDPNKYGIDLSDYVFSD